MTQGSYTPSVRTVEIAGILSFAALAGIACVRLGPPAAQEPMLALGALLLGYFSADFASGVIHWAADTWGSMHMPILGRAFLRPFREHHLDPKAITRHDFIETNGNNCIASLPVLGVLATLIFETPASRFFAYWLFSLVAWLFVTNQLHKWAHTDVPPGWVAWLQRCRIILPPTHHNVHHTPPYHRNYCITSGWMNAPLAWMHLLPALETLITHTTGALPRRDDLGEYAALQMALENARRPAPEHAAS
ncbi:MAG: fatty acid desaturase family protein [Myxococcaceae bacterium]